MWDVQEQRQGQRHRPDVGPRLYQVGVASQRLKLEGSRLMRQVCNAWSRLLASDAQAQPSVQDVRCDFG